MGFGRARCELEHAAERADRLRRMAEPGLDHAESRQRAGVVGRDANGILHFLGGLREVILAGKDQAKVDERLSILRVVLDSLPEQRFCFKVAPLLAVEHTQIVLAFGILRIERERRFPSWRSSNPSWF